MKRIVRLTESDLARIVKRVINEQAETPFAKYGDFITFENARDMDPRKVYASLGSTVTPTKVPSGVGNLITVNADVYQYKSQDGQWKFTGKERVTFVQQCGGQSNLMIMGNEFQDKPGWYSKPDGKIQQKLTASCKAQGFKGQIQSPGGQFI